MFLRNPREGRDGLEPENIIEAVDPRTGNVVASCSVHNEFLKSLYPDRPFQIRLEFGGASSDIDSLLGAAIARARSLCAAQEDQALIYAPCSIDDLDLFDVLLQYGFGDKDGLDRMYANLPLNETSDKPPMGTVIIHDKLEDPQEQRYFLDRYNEIYGTAHDGIWLNELKNREGFRRLICVAPTGMVGEIVVWFDGECGVIEFFNTARRWRRKGIAAYMLNLACQYIHNSGCKSACADVRASIPYACKVLRNSGFDIVERIIHYPTIEL